MSRCFQINDDATGKYRVLLDLTGVTVGKVARADVARSFFSNSPAMTSCAGRHC